MSGKGDRPRPLSVSREVFESNWEEIFGRKSKQDAALQALVDEAQEMGLYDIVENPLIKDNEGR